MTQQDTSRRILMVIAPDQFRDEELHIPRDRFSSEGWSVDTVSTRTGNIVGMLGATENVSDTLQTITITDYDAIVVVGGMGSAKYLWNDVKLHETLKTMNNAKKIISAICLSGVVLAKAGLLEGKKATVWEMPESLEALKAGNCTYTNEPVTTDDRIITANGPEAAESFADAIVSKVNSLVPAH